MWVMRQQDDQDLDVMLGTALTYANGTAVYELSAEERGAIHAVYQLYDALLGQPHTDLTPNALDKVRPYMEAAFGQVQIGGRLAALRARLLASIGSCPYCGFGEPRELDHYLPRSIYGELAIYPNNLIPSCSACNNAKRAAVPGLGSAHGPGLIHPYFQVLPNQDFLKAEVAFAGGALVVGFRIDFVNMNPDLVEKLQFQLDRLKLNDRYARQINKFLSEQRTAFLMFLEINPELFSEYLRRSADSLAGSFGRNDWRVALLRALSNSPAFCAEPELYLDQLPRQ